MAWDEATKQKAVRITRERGLAAAAKETGVPKATVGRWAKAAGVDIVGPAHVKHAHAVKQAAVLVARVDRFESFLEYIQTEAGRYVHTVATLNREWAEAVVAASGGDFQMKLNVATGEEWARPDAATAPELYDLYVKMKALRQASLEVPHAVGAWTRATHDLRLLQERSTENTAIVVQSMVPRPVGEVEAVVVDVEEV